MTINFTILESISEALFQVRIFFNLVHLNCIFLQNWRNIFFGKNEEKRFFSNWRNFLHKCGSAIIFFLFFNLKGILFGISKAISLYGRDEGKAYSQIEVISVIFLLRIYTCWASKTWFFWTKWRRKLCVKFKGFLS